MHSGFRATFDEVVLVVADMMSDNILVKEMSRLHHARPLEAHAEYKNAVRSYSYDLSQRRSEESTKSR